MKRRNLISKTAICLYLVLAVCYSSFSQEADTVKIDTTVNKICLERGHVSVGVIMKTAMYCTPYSIDTDSTTVMVYPACNYESFTCKRCGKYVSQLEKERRVVIWRKEE
jgi:hypothetical protein